MPDAGEIPLLAQGIRLGLQISKIGPSP